MRENCKGTGEMETEEEEEEEAGCMHTLSIGKRVKSEYNKRL